VRRLAAIAGMLLTASACASPPQTEPSPPYARPAAEPAPIATPAQSPSSPQKDACGAAELQGLIGHPRTEIPVPVQPDRQRVACTTCPVTQDYRPDRLNFFFDAGAGLIREIKCG